MRSLLRPLSLILCLCATVHAAAADMIERVASPDGHIVLELAQKLDAAGKRALSYNVRYDGETVIRDSLLELRLDNHLSENAMALPVDHHARWFENLRVTDVRRAGHDSTWTPVTGERTRIRDHYEALTVDLVKDDNPTYKLSVEVRAYDAGVALRFAFPENEKGTYYRVIGEDTEFALPAGTKAWFHGWAQGPYQLMPLANWPDQAERPLTLQLPNGLSVALLEGQMVDYARTKFKLSLDKPDTLVTAMHDPADLVSPFATPWRGIMIARRPGQLIENNDFILNLNAPSRIADTSWIKPGKIMRVMSLTTRDAKANIDFAARHKLQYVLFDFKWYGNAFSFDADATKVAIPDFDLPAIIAYAKSKGIGVWLYVNQQGLMAQSDTLFQTYRDWGVAGVKFGFVQVGSHRWTTWLEKTIQQAAAAHIMVNIHDDWRPTGEQRTWPNLLTAEGIRGNEEMPDATHNTVLPFVRYLAGAADYTICYYDPRIRTTHAHQLALAVIYYSPLQTLYWYDKPERSHDEPELAFWDRIPTTWDETRVLDGAPGRDVTIARRKGDEWFVGSITNNDARRIPLRFDFLPKGKRYEATIYADDPAAQTATHVGIRTRTVDASTVLQLDLPASGGQALWLRPL
jgi:alpha-glucosidase